jgi:hypothetical protein
MKKIKYKVVKRRSRKSAMINGNSKYALEYQDGWTVYADAKTLGVLVFETAHAAAEWAWIWNTDNGFRETRDLIVLKVIPVGRGKRINWVANGILTETLDEFYRDGGIESGPCIDTPHKTMAYPGVEVIGEFYHALVR